MNIHRMKSYLSVISLLFFLSLPAQAGVYFNYPVEKGLNLVASPFDTGQNRVAQVFAHVPAGAAVHKCVNGQYTTNIFNGEKWQDESQQILPGEGVFLYIPDPDFRLIAFFGEPRFGTFTNAIPQGLSAHGVPTFVKGKVTTDLGLKLAPFSQLYLHSTNRFKVYTYMTGGVWAPSEPSIVPGQGFLVSATAPTNWVVTFNQP